MGKKILVTGGLGFIGSHFVEHLIRKDRGSNITILDAKTYCVSNNTILFLENLSKTRSVGSLNIIINNISDIRTLGINVNDYDYIVNFAAESHVDNSISDSSGVFLDTNVCSVNDILQECLNAEYKGRFVQISTDEVYGALSKYQKSSTEDDTLNPSSIYSSTKAAAEHIALSYNKTHGLDVMVTRCCNNFGPRQYTEKLIPVVISKAMNNEKIPVYGTGENVRQWIFVRDHCEQIYDVMMYGEPGEIYNIAPSYENISELSNITLVKKIINLLGKDYDLIEYVGDRKGHDMRYSINSTKVYLLRARNGLLKTKNLYDWTENTLDRDLTLTVKWYTKYPSWWDSGYVFEP